METSESDTSQALSHENDNENAQNEEISNSKVDLIFEMEEVAKVRAAKQIAAMLRRPEQLERVILPLIVFGVSYLV